jgi:NAD(P) transhydrogenase
MFKFFPTQSQQQKQQQPQQQATVYDLAVIGGGVVGVQAALSAAALSSSSSFGGNKSRVILIDAPTASGALQDANGKDLSLGGPTGLFGKALRDSSKQIKVATLRGMGLREDSIWNEIISNCVELASSNADDVLAQLEAAGVVYKQGFCAFGDAGATDALIVTTTQQPNNGLQETINAKNVLIATGSQPFRPANIPFDGGRRVLDSDSINKLQFLPRSIAITGSGIIAVEFAKIFRNLGADVTLIIRDLIPRNALAKIGLDIE